MYNSHPNFNPKQGEYTMKPFSMQEVHDGLMNEQNDVLFIEERDFKDKNLSRIINELYRYEPDWKGIVFKKCYFNDVSFEGITIDKPLKFKECSFYGEVLFKKCNFCEDLSFFRSIFYKTTVFDNCCYANHYFDFSEIQTRESCKYFAILNTQHNQKFDKPCYTILDFSDAIFQSIAVFNELKDLSFTFGNTTFGNEFYFSNTFLGTKTIFQHVNYPNENGNLTKTDLKRCFQILMLALKNQSALSYDAEKIKERIKFLDTDKTIANKEIYTEQEMCDYVGIGRATFQRLKTQVKQGERLTELPIPCKQKPLLYPRSEVEKFKEIWIGEKMAEKARKNEE